MAARPILTSSLSTFSRRAYSSKADKNVAFLGLGNMGGFMAANLVKKGFNVTGYDPSKETLTAAEKNGIKGASSIAAAVESADAIVSILPSNKVVLDAYLGKDGVVKHVSKELERVKGASSIAAAVENADAVVSMPPSNKVVLDACLSKDGVVEHVIKELERVKGANSIAVAVESADAVVSILQSNKVVLNAYLGKDGVVKHAQKGALLIDSSTVDPNVPKEIFPVAIESGVGFIDAPVSGGVMGAQNATLAFMSGGRKGDFDRSLPLLEAMGAKQFHCGDIGAGQVAKLANNMLMGITGMATAECMNMGIKMGLDPKVLLDVLNNSSARSWSTEVYCPVPGLVPTAPSSRNYDGGFKNELMVKDLELASGMALGIRSPIPLGAVATQLYRIAQARGFGQKDFSYVYQLLKEDKK